MRGLKVGDKVRILECPPRPEYQFKVGEILTITKVYDGVEFGDDCFYGFRDRRAIRGHRVAKVLLENKLGGKIL